MIDPHDMPGEPGELAASVPLAEVRAALTELETLEDEVRHPMAHLDCILPPEQARLAWAVRDAEERLGLGQRLLAEDWLVERLARRLPEHAATIRSEAHRLSGREGEAPYAR